MSLKNVFVFANSTEPDEMPPNTAFHLGLHCLSKYLECKWMKIFISKCLILEVTPGVPAYWAFHVGR